MVKRAANSIFVPSLILILMPILAQALVPRCDGKNPDFTNSPYCLPNDYNMDIVPPTEGPLHINVDIFVFEVSRIDDIALSMTFELYFDLTWNESRLLINDSAPEWIVDGTVMGSTNFVKSMWLPDIQILNLKQFQKRQIVTDVAGLIIFKNKSVLYTVSTEAIISCPMKFSAYPLDHQECKFNVGSYIHDATQIHFTGTFGHDTVNQRAQQYEINITALDESDKTVIWANRNYSQTGFKINLKRRRTPVLLQTYLPSGLFVVVSWISFIVPPEVVPGRMALLVTLFLVLVNIFNSVTANAPKSEGLTAVETWVVMCILHVFCVLSEYAIILKIIQIEKRKVTAKLRKLDKANNAALTASNTSLNNKSFSSLSATPNMDQEVSGSGRREFFLDKFTRCCRTTSNCCAKAKDNHASSSPDEPPFFSNGGSHHDASSDVLAERLAVHHNCGCEDHAHHRSRGNGRGQPKIHSRVKASPSPPEQQQQQQVFEADPQYIAMTRPLTHSHAHNLHEDNFNVARHRGHAHNRAGHYGPGPHMHIAHRHQCGGGGGAADPPSATPTHHTTTTTTGFDNDLSWTKIDLAGMAHNAKLAASGAGHGVSSPTPSNVVRSSNNEQWKVAAKYEKIDRIAMWLFPIIFFLFNVCYWSYFLLLADALQDLWNCGGFGDCEKMKKQCDHYAYACDDYA